MAINADNLDSLFKVTMFLRTICGQMNKKVNPDDNVDTVQVD